MDPTSATAATCVLCAATPVAARTPEGVPFAHCRVCGSMDRFPGRRLVVDGVPAPPHLPGDFGTTAPPDGAAVAPGLFRWRSRATSGCMVVPVLAAAGLVVLFGWVALGALSGAVFPGAGALLSGVFLLLAFPAVLYGAALLTLNRIEVTADSGAVSSRQGPLRVPGDWSVPRDRIAAVYARGRALWNPGDSVRTTEAWEVGVLLKDGGVRRLRLGLAGAGEALRWKACIEDATGVRRADLGPEGGVVALAGSAAAAEVADGGAEAPEPLCVEPPHLITLVRERGEEFRWSLGRAASRSMPVLGILLTLGSVAAALALLASGGDVDGSEWAMPLMFGLIGGGMTFFGLRALLRGMTVRADADGVSWECGPLPPRRAGRRARADIVAVAARREIWYARMSRGSRGGGDPPERVEHRVEVLLHDGTAETVGISLPTRADAQALARALARILDVRWDRDTGEVRS